MSLVVPDAPDQVHRAARVRTLAADVVGLIRSVRQLDGRRRRTGELPTALNGVLGVVRRLGEARASTVAAALGVDLSVVSRQVADAEARHLLVRRRDPDDGRAWLLTLSPAGQEALAAVDAERDQLIADALRAWSDEDLDATAAVLRRLHDALVADG